MLKGAFASIEFVDCNITFSAVESITFSAESLDFTACSLRGEAEQVLPKKTISCKTNCFRFYKSTISNIAMQDFLFFISGAPETRNETGDKCAIIFSDFRNISGRTLFGLFKFDEVYVDNSSISDSRASLVYARAIFQSGYIEESDFEDAMEPWQLYLHLHRCFFPITQLKSVPINLEIPFQCG